MTRHDNAADTPSPAAHIPVLAEAFVDALFTRPDGRYLDCTFGRGGHARLLLARLSDEGRLLALDRDPEAIACGEQLAASDARFSIRHADFERLEEALDAEGWETVDGVGFDLGLSSPQVDDPARGFSFLREGPLDMRMNPESGPALAALLDRSDERALARVLRDYGDERFAPRIARAILRARREGRLATTRDLENICFHAVPPKARHGNTHPATRTFQALRIWVNRELDQIHAAIRAAIDRLAPGGRLAVISFHSGEDRLVRDLIEAAVNPCECPPQFPVCMCGKQPTMRWIQKKPLRPDEEEVRANPRARSARLRVAERLPAESAA